MIYIIIPVFNRWNYTKTCLDCLQNQTYKDFKVLVVDHGSSDNTREKISKHYESVTLIEGDESMWWTAATNIGINYALSKSNSVNEDYILTLNNDVEVSESYLSELLNIAKVYGKCLVGSTVVDIKNPEKIVFLGNKWSKYTAKYKKPAIINESYSSLSKRVSCIGSDLLPGRGLLIPMIAFAELGMYDQETFPHYCADEDMSLRCKTNGYILLVSIKAVVKSYFSSNVYALNIFQYLKHTYFSRKSPTQLITRYRWAKKNTPLPILYFTIDNLRIFYSVLKSYLEEH